MQSLSFPSALNTHFSSPFDLGCGGGCCSWKETIPLKTPFSGGGKGFHLLMAPQGAESTVEVHCISITHLQGKARNGLIGMSLDSAGLCTKVQQSFHTGDSRTSKRMLCASLISHSLKNFKM